jgi:hypothetical protein
VKYQKIKSKTTHMRQFILFFSTFLFALAATAQMDLTGNGFNPRASISEEVGITSITIKYSRPGVKGRDGKIWGRVVANGFSNYNFTSNTISSPWKAGANEVTVISFEHDVKVEGADLKAGTYALFMAMDPDSVTIIFSSQTDAWGSFYYREVDDVLRVKVKPVVLDKTVEWLKYEFIHHEEQSCVIAMQWEKLSVPFKVDVDVHPIVLERLREQMTSVKGFLSANLIHAAMYCYENNINLEEALGWAERAVTGQPYGQTGFDAYQFLATGYEKLNRQHQADSVMDEGLAIANLNQYISYGRALISQKRFDRSVGILLAAKEKFGDRYMVNNELSYAFSGKEEFSRALEHADHALAQAPGEKAKNRIKENIKKLKEGKDINQ